MQWIVLIVAGLMEIVWALAIKNSQGFTRLWPTLVAILCLPASVALLTFALKHLPVGTAYAVWVGIGAAGVAITGMLWLGEAFSWPKVACLVLILAGVVGLHQFEAHPSETNTPNQPETKS
jgi:quaternary ammonium compound-resistance protein SugE